MNTALISTKPSFLKDSEDNNLDVSAASYLGGSGGDSATAVDISLDGKTVIIGGKTPNHSPGGQQFSLIGGGDGLIMRYDSRTNQVLSSTRLPGQVRDLEVNPKTGEIAIAYGSGIALLSADASKVIWSKSLVNAERIAVSGKGNVTVLQENASGSTDIVTLYSQSGESLQTWSTSGSRYFQDVAISDQDGGAVVITGFKQARIDLQVAFTQAWAYDGKARWTAYDHSAQAVDAVNLLADTRGERIAFGRDGKLYSANSINGGTGYSIFSREPANLSQKASSKIVVADKYTNAFLTGTVAMTWFGEYDLKTGGLVKGQGLLTRRSNGSGNSITPDAITADEQGNIYLSGKASASLENRDNQRIEGQRVSGYRPNDGFLAIISPDLKTRYAWTPISKAQETAVAVRGGVAAVVATTDFEGTQITDNPIQSRAGGGKDGYFLILGGQDDVPVGSSPIPAPAPGPMQSLISGFDKIIFHFDGNNNDRDDIAALPVAAAIAKSAGIQNKTTFFYGNNLSEANVTSQVQAMDVSGAFAKKLGIAAFDYQDGIEKTTAEVVKILNSGEKVLAVEGGPMEAIYRAIQQTSPANRSNLTLLSHSTWNEDRKVGQRPGGGTPRTWADLRSDFPQITQIDIKDQNKSATGGFYNQDWTWLDSTNNPVLQEMREKMRNVGGQQINDASDAGMLFYAITGQEDGDPSDAKAFFNQNPPTFAGSTPPSAPTPTPAPPSPAPDPVSSQPLLKFSLVDANTDKIVEKYETILDNSVINLNDLGLEKYSLVAQVNSERPDSSLVKSVKFISTLGNRTENDGPYSLFGDFNGNFAGQAPTTGNFTVKATAYSATGGTGSVLDSTEIDYTLTNESIARLSAEAVARDLLGPELSSTPATMNKSMSSDALTITPSAFEYGQGIGQQASFGEDNTDFNVMAVSHDPVLAAAQTSLF